MNNLITKELSVSNPMSVNAPFRSLLGQSFFKKTRFAPCIEHKAEQKKTKKRTHHSQQRIVSIKLSLSHDEFSTTTQAKSLRMHNSERQASRMDNSTI